MRPFRVRYKQKHGLWYAERWTWLGWVQVDFDVKRWNYGIEKVPIGHKFKDGALNAIDAYKKSRREKLLRPRDCIEYVE